MYASFSILLKKRRCMTQEQAAEKLGVSVSTIQNWERGACIPDVRTIDTIETLYGIESGKLLMAALQDARHSNGATDDENEKGSCFPYFLFGPDRVHDIENCRFTKEQQELFGLLCLYSRSSSIGHSEHLDSIEISRHIPYGFTAKYGAFNVLKMLSEISQIHKTADKSTFHDSLIRNYLTAHPDKLFALDELPRDLILQWIEDKVYNDLPNLVAALENILPAGDFRLGAKSREYYSFSCYNAPPWANKLCNDKGKVDEVFGGEELYRIESRDNDDPEVIAKITQYEKDLEAFNRHPNLYDRKPSEPADMQCDWLVLTENGRRLINWMRMS